MVDVWPVKRSLSLPDLKHFVCTLCAGSLKFQELPFKDNNYRVYQTEVTRTIISDSVKYSGYSEEVNTSVTPHSFLDVT